MRKRFKTNRKKDRRAFARSGAMMNSKNLPRLSIGGIRF